MRGVILIDQLRRKVLTVFVALVLVVFVEREFVAKIKTEKFSNLKYLLDVLNWNNLLIKVRINGMNIQSIEIRAWVLAIFKLQYKTLIFYKSLSIFKS